MKRWWILGVIAAAVAGSIALRLVGAARDPEPGQIETMERELAELGAMLRPLSCTIPAGNYGLVYEAETLDLYFRDSSSDSCERATVQDARLYVWADALALTRGARQECELRKTGNGWEIFEVVMTVDAPAPEQKVLSEFQMEDRFMRKDLAPDGEWRIKQGIWRMEKHGGGMVSREEDASAMRAVNPFTLKGQQVGDEEIARLEYARVPRFAGNLLIEARIEFRGESGYASTIRPFYLLQGRGEDELRFGWDGSRWELALEDEVGAWHPLQTWRKRPPVGTWARVGLAVENGTVAVAQLDGVELGRVELPRVVQPGLAIETASTRGIEVDDVVCRALRAPKRLQPLFVKSAAFSKKEAVSGRDPVQFEHWARGRNTFIKLDGVDSRLNLSKDRVRVRLPLFADFIYQSMPDFPFGDYQFILMSKEVPAQPADVLQRLDVVKTEGGSWKLPADDMVLSLEFGRADGQFYYVGSKGRQVMGAPYQGPAYLMIVPPSQQLLAADRHELRSDSIWHELFEQAPSDWYWHNGGFGMNTRWACQPGWNFMAGKSQNAAVLHSKRSFHGDQVVDAYLSLAAALSSQQQYYIRRDLNVSFCTNGYDVNSGYSVMFGADNNRVTQLRRKGVVIAETTDREFRFPIGTNHHEVHWRMWHFECRKEGTRVIVRYNGRTMFDVQDEEPLEGGHLALWTVANAFTVSRVTVAAERQALNPEVSWQDYGDLTSAWKPLDPDSVRLSTREALTDVENAVSGGTLGVWQAFSVNLQETPILELPLQVSGAKVNLHIQIGSATYLVAISAPTGQMMNCLKPKALARFSRSYLRADNGLKLIGSARPVAGLLVINLGEMINAVGSVPGSTMVTLTVGNSSNEEYLLVGTSGNPKGTRYTIGMPTWRGE